MSGSSTTYDSNGSATISSVLGEVTSVLVTHDASTPAGELPTVSLTVDLTLLGAVNVVAENGGVADVDSIIGAAGGLSIRADGGTVNLDPATVGVLTGTVIDIENGGTASANGTFLGILDASSVAFGPGTGTLDFDSNGTLLNLGSSAPITGFSSGDSIVDMNALLASVGSYRLSNPILSSTQLVTFYTGTGGGGTALGSITFAAGTLSGANGTYNRGSGPLQLIAGPGGALELAVCFLSGTRIATEFGEIRVERIGVGDRVVALQGEEMVLKPVTWIGSRTIIASDNSDDEAFPIRIRAGAFDVGVPLRDLLITPEHGVFLDGHLIPARMLVNGMSILIDRAISNYTYYHIELADHSVLLAEGLPTESYLDTGNRGNFSNASVAALKPDLWLNTEKQRREISTALPLAVDSEFVKPAWVTLVERAKALGMVPRISDVTLTSEPDLHLVTDSDLVLRPLLITDDTYSFMLPNNTQFVYLVSRSARPSDTIGPYIDDRRKLGVRVNQIHLGIGSERKSVDLCLLDNGLTGWHMPETGIAGRWTNGKALLPVDRAAFRGRAAFLDIQVAQVGSYAVPIDHTSESSVSWLADVA